MNLIRNVVSFLTKIFRCHFQCTNEDDAKSKKEIAKTKDTSDHDDSSKQISSGGGGGGSGSGKSWASLFHKDPPSVNSGM